MMNKNVNREINLILNKITTNVGFTTNVNYIYWKQQFLLKFSNKNKVKMINSKFKTTRAKFKYLTQKTQYTGVFHALW